MTTDAQTQAYYAELAEPDNDMPTTTHSILQRALTRAIEAASDDKLMALPQLTLNLGGWTTIPDLALYPAGALALDIFDTSAECTLAPVGVVEILSPQQKFGPLVEKVNRYVALGVKSAWLVLPGTSAVAIYLPGRKPIIANSGLLRDPATGVEIDLDKLFA